MNQDLLKQKEYWDREVNDFDSVYARGKSKFNNWIDATFRWDISARFDYTMENAEPIQDRTFLDVGCGTGRYALEFARRGARRIVGIDIAEKMLAVCEQRAREEHLEDRCSFEPTDLTQYQPDAQFDVCTGIGLFDYIREPLPVLTRMREVVSDRAIMSFPRFWTWRAPVRRVRLALRQCDVYFYTKERIDTLLKQAGFKRYTMQQVGQLFCVTAFV
jgi:cyclopropane fatty-acyl-phospholipid synthase-like methyltransferase